MRDFYIFDIPVYRTTKERYYADMDAAVEAHLKVCFDDQGLPRSDRQTVESVTGHAREAFGGPWDFNDVVGWIRLFIEGYGVGAHLWWVDGKQIRRNMRKRFHLTTASNCLWTDFPPPADSPAIFKGTLEALESLSQRDKFKKRHVDLSVFQRTGPFIDWRRLRKAGVDHSNQRNADGP